MKKLATDIYTFEHLIERDYLYIDKTEYLWNLIQSGVLYFLARPRRFGKSLTVSTLKAIFSGKRELFKGLAIYDKPYDWKKYPVIHIDMNGRNLDSLEAVKDSFCEIIAEQARALQVPLEMEEPVTMFQKLIERASADTQVVVLVDEYDKPILNNLTEPNVHQILKALKAFYSVIKEKSSRIRFAFVTGITKFCHVSLFSDLNNLTDISMDARYATMLGYTQAEMESNFKEWIEATEAKQTLPHGEWMDKIKKWYDGYCFEENSETVYNPVSLASFFDKQGKFQNYWFSTGTPTFLLELIKQRQLNLEQAVTEPVSAFSFSAFEIDNISPLTLLVQTGYLTIKSSENFFDQTRYHLDFPNREVSESFNVYLLDAYSRITQGDVANFGNHLIAAITQRNLPKFQEALESFFAGIPYGVHRKREDNFQNVFFAIFKMLGYRINAESQTSDGRIDAVIETKTDVYLFEFKLNKDDSALTQIKEKKYFKPYLLSSKKITLVGANFDTETGRLSDWQHEEIIRG